MGPLQGFRVIELAGIGPGPFCGMMLSDMVAEVIRVDRIGGAGNRRGRDVLARNRRSIAVDLKQPQGVELVLKLVETADALFEGFRRASPSVWASAPTNVWRATKSSSTDA